MKATLKKPHLTEIFAAFNGIGYAAMGALALSHGDLSNPLCQLEERSSNLRYKLRQNILDNMALPDQDNRQARIARQALDFLRSARPTLKEHLSVQLAGATADAKGGTVSDVIADIDHLLAREKKGTERSLVTSKGGGELFPRVKKDYFPVVVRDVPEKATEMSVTDDQKIKQATGRRGGKKKATIFQSTFVDGAVPPDNATSVAKPFVKVAPAEALTLSVS